MTSGFEMRDTIEWYEKNKAEILARLPQATNESLGFRTRDREQIQLSTPDLAALVHLFPEAARERSLLKYIVGKPETWFHPDSLTAPRPVVTRNIEEAISPTAIVPSYHSVGGWPDYTNILLYEISSKACSDDVRKIILAEGFVHEFAHTINAPALFLENYVLELPNGDRVGGREYILSFTKLAEKHSPMSHYSSTYRTEDNDFKGTEFNEIFTSINEELAETIAARLLGFTFCNEDYRRMDPFVDRPEIKEWTDNFLNARLVE